MNIYSSFKLLNLLTQTAFLWHNFPLQRHVTLRLMRSNSGKSIKGFSVLCKKIKLHINVLELFPPFLIIQTQFGLFGVDQHFFFFCFLFFLQIKISVAAFKSTRSILWRTCFCCSDSCKRLKGSQTGGTLSKKINIQVLLLILDWI